MENIIASVKILQEAQTRAKAEIIRFLADKDYKIVTTDKLIIGTRFISFDPSSDKAETELIEQAEDIFCDMKDRLELNPDGVNVIASFAKHGRMITYSTEFFADKL